MLKKYPTLTLYFHPKIIAILFLGLASGLPLALVMSTLSVWLTEAGVTRTAIGLFAAVTTPYALKFIWSPLIDQMPLPLFTKFFGRRRGWMIFTQLCLFVSIIGLGMTNPYENPWMTALWALFVSIASASQDIVIDAYRVELLEENQQGAGAAVIVLGYRIGMLISGAGALLLAHYTNWLTTYVVMAMFVGVGVVTVLISGEPEKTFKPLKTHGNALHRLEEWLIEAVLNPLGDFVSRKGWLVIALFILLYKFGDAFAGVMTNPFLIDMGFSKLEIAEIVKTFGFVALIVGSFIGGGMINRIGLIKSLWICGVLQCLSNLMFMVQAHVGHDIFVLAWSIGLENLSGGMGTAAFVAYLSSLCNVRYTATQYALFSSLASVGRTWLSTSSGWFVDQLGWSNFFIFSTVLGVPGLLMLFLMQKVASESGESNKKDKH